MIFLRLKVIMGVEEIKQHLKKYFVTKNLGQLRYFLDIKVARGKQRVILSQRKYTMNLLQENRILGTRSTAPIDPDPKS